MAKRKKVSYYAVRVGRVPGVYTEWGACSAQVTGFGGAEFKRFDYEDDARLYLHRNEKAATPNKTTSSLQPPPPNQVLNEGPIRDPVPGEDSIPVKPPGETVDNLGTELLDPGSFIVFYCDGSCVVQTGSAGCAAIMRYRKLEDDDAGCKYKEEIFMSRSAYLGAGLTNNFAELKAVEMCLNILGDVIRFHPELYTKMSKIKINSDSEYAINSCSGVYNGKCNIELINSIKASIKRYESYGFSISFHWVKGHSENKFNNKVDQLAYAAATEKKPNTEHS